MDTRIAVIFGGSGFIGRHMANRLLTEGWRVRICCRHPQRLSLASPVPGQLSALRVPLHDKEAVAAALTGAELAINAVGIITERRRRGQTFDLIHRQQAETCAQQAQRAGLRSFIHISTLGASEDSPSHYARSKALGEQAVRAAFPQATIFRPSLVVGAGDHVLSLYLLLANFSPFLPLIGARTRFQPIAVGDVAAAAVAALALEHAGKTYDLGGPEVLSFKEMITKLMAALGLRRSLVPIPLWLAALQAPFWQWLPGPLPTPDQIRLLRIDNVVAAQSLGLSALGLRATAFEDMLMQFARRRALSSQAAAREA